MQGTMVNFVNISQSQEGYFRKYWKRHFLNLVLMFVCLSVCPCNLFMFSHFNHETELFPIIRDRVRSIQEKGLQRQEQREPTETQAVYETRQAVLRCGLGTLSLPTSITVQRRRVRDVPHPS